MEEKSYMIGQEYRADIKKPIVMKFYTHISSFFPLVNIEDKRIKISSKAQALIIEYTEDISSKLLEDVKNGKGTQYIWVYFNLILPYINAAIQYNKYKKGQYLCKPLCMYDIIAIEIIENGNIIVTLPPQTFDDFYKTAKYTEELNYIYIRDFIDAIAAISYSNYEECIRRIITTIESFYKSKNIKKTTFKATLIDQLKKINHSYGRSVIKKNLCYIYDLRNLIVHDTLRILDYKEEWKFICHLGITSLRYFLCAACDDEKEQECLMSIFMQYYAIYNITDGAMAWIVRNDFECGQDDEIDSSRILDDDADIDEILYKTIEIDDELKKAVGI